VIIVSDDQGYRDLGCFGSDEVITPHLDQLAREGVRLTDFYVTWPACTPSRGSLLTGRYPQRHGVYDMIRNEAPDYGYRYTPEEYEVTFERIGGMDTREILLPQMLREAGYVSGIFGKWDLGSLKRFLPRARGFHSFYGFVNTGIDYFTHERYGVPSMYRDQQPTTEDKGTYCTDLFRREAVRFLNQHRDGPFFLYLPFNAPHNASNLDPKIRSGAQATDEYRAKYPDLQAKAGDVRRDTRYAKNAAVRNKASKRLEYVASITAMDDAIGVVLGMLDDFGIADETIVIFFSDNGGGGGSDNSPLRGGKGQMYEGGVRVPCVVRYPQRIPAGRTCAEFLTTLEIVPTLLNLAGVQPPEGVTLDGFDMMEILAGRQASLRTQMFWQRRGDKAARVGSWKWVESTRGSGLFNLKSDVGEARDVSAEYPEKLKELKTSFSRWRSEMDAAEPRGPFRDF
jgi:arylsulfatase A-like enzyme